MSDLVSERKVATQLGVSVQCLQKWRATKKGPEYVRLGNRVRYDPDAVQKFIDERRIKPAE